MKESRRQRGGVRREIKNHPVSLKTSMGSFLISKNQWQTRHLVRIVPTSLICIHFEISEKKMKNEQDEESADISWNDSFLLLLLFYTTKTAFIPKLILLQKWSSISLSSSLPPKLFSMGYKKSINKWKLFSHFLLSFLEGKWTCNGALK